jgi:hypothetical protein
VVFTWKFINKACGREGIGRADHNDVIPNQLPEIPRHAVKLNRKNRLEIIQLRRVPILLLPARKKSYLIKFLYAIGNESLTFEEPILIEDDQFGPVGSPAMVMSTEFPFGA